MIYSLTFPQRTWTWSRNAGMNVSCTMLSRLVQLLLPFLFRNKDHSILFVPKEHKGHLDPLPVVRSQLVLTPPNQLIHLGHKSNSPRSLLSSSSRADPSLDLSKENSPSDSLQSILSFLQRQGSHPICLPENLPVGGRLQKFWTIWKELGLDPWAVSVIKDGYYLIFHTPPPVSRVPLVRSGSTNPIKNNLLAQQFQILLDNV